MRRVFRCAGGFVAAPTPTPTPSGLVATPNLSGEQPISAASFADLLATNGGADGNVYRVLTGGVPTVINPGNFTYTKAITFYPDYRGEYETDPYGSGKPHKTHFQRMLSILGLNVWKRQNGPITAYFTEFALPNIWPDVANGQTWQDIVPTDAYIAPNPLRGVINTSGNYPLKLYSCQISGHYHSRGTPIPFGVALPEGDGPSEFYGASSSTHPELQGVYSATSDAIFSLNHTQLDVTPGPGTAIGSCRNLIGAGPNAGKIYNAVAQMPVAIKPEVTSGYTGEIYTENLLITDFGGSMALEFIRNAADLQMWWPVFRRTNCLQLEANMGNPASGLRTWIKAPIFDQPLFDATMIGLGHNDLCHMVSGAGDGIWTDVEEDHFFLNWNGSVRSQLIDGHLQPVPPGFSNKQYADGPKKRRCLTPGVGGDGFSYTSASRAYVVGNKSVTPAFDGRTLSDNTAINVIGPTNFTAPGAFSRIESNVAESYEIDSAVTKSNKLLAPHDTAGQTGVFGSGITSVPANAEALYQKMVAGDPLFSAFPTLIDFIEGVTDMSAMPLDVSFYPIVGATPGASVTGEPLLIHGGNEGDTFAGTCSAGLTVEIVSPDAHSAFSTVAAVAGTQIAAPSASPSLISGKKAVAHVTAPAASGGVADYTLTAGGQTFTQRVISASTNIYPIASVSSYKWSKTAAGFGTSTATKLSFAAIIRPSAFTVQQSLFTVSNGNAVVSIRLNGTRLTVQAKDSSGATVFTADYDNSHANLFSSTSDNTILVSIDRTQADILAGLKVYANNKAVMPSKGWVWTAGTMDLSGKLELLSDTYFNFSFTGTVSLLAATSENIGATILDGFRIAPSIPEAASGTTAGANTGGRLMSPTSRQWEVWIAGKASLMNAGTHQGSMTGFTVTGTATQSTDATWPL